MFTSNEKQSTSGNHSINVETHQKNSFNFLIITLSLLLSTPAFAYDYETPEQAKHHNHRIEHELDSKYSNHQGLENLDQRFWTLYNEASGVLSTARDQVNTTNSFVYQHNMASLNANENAQYKALVNPERQTMKKWFLLRDELLDIVFNASQAGADVKRYEDKLVDQMADGKRLEVKISDRPF